MEKYIEKREKREKETEKERERERERERKREKRERGERCKVQFNESLVETFHFLNQIFDKKKIVCLFENVTLDLILSLSPCLSLSLVLSLTLRCFSIQNRVNCRRLV
jgi:hypothetical protein